MVSLNRLPVHQTLSTDGKITCAEFKRTKIASVFLKALPAEVGNEGIFHLGEEIFINSSSMEILKQENLSSWGT